MAPQYDLVVVADYGHSMITMPAVELLCEHARYLAINTQANAGNIGYHTVSKYPHADFVCIAENELRLECRSHSSDLKPLLKSVADRLRTRRIVATRGKSGSLCLSEDGCFYEAPSVAAK